MPGNFKYEDIRVQRTNEALTEAMSKLLDLRNFNKITVNDICDGAQIGRSTFYSHFQDKYDFLKYWLTKTQSVKLSESGTQPHPEKRINDFVTNNGKLIRHLVEDANSETLGLLCDFLLSLLQSDMTNNRQISAKYSVLTKFCCGGIMSYLEWQATTNSKTDSKEINSYFYDILMTLYQWSAEQN